MNSSIRIKLFVMMVLEFFIWGAWLPLIFGYLPSLNFTPSQQAWVLNAFPIAAIVGMFFSNQFADRNFAAEKFLGFSHLIGGVAMIGLAYTKAFWPFFGLMLLHCLLYVPTISITNSIAFANMKDAQKEFGIVRMGGTVGWILAAWPFTFILVDWDAVKAAHPSGIVDWVGSALAHGLTGAKLQEATSNTYLVAGIASLLLAAFSLTLPHTPPKKAEEGAESLAWLESMKLLKHPFVLVLWIVTLIDSTVHNSYFMWTGSFLGTAVDKGGVGIPGNWIMPVMSIGQVAEISTMFILGATLKKLGWKWTMVLGVLGHAIRFGAYAFLAKDKEVIILIQILHGICYAFFFATVYIFVEEFFPKDARASAQGLFNVMILGVGALMAATACPPLFSAMTSAAGITNFHNLFLIPLGLGIAAAVALTLFFNPPARSSQNAAAPVTPH